MHLIYRSFVSYRCIARFGSELEPLRTHLLHLNDRRAAAQIAEKPQGCPCACAYRRLDLAHCVKKLNFSANENELFMHIYAAPCSMPSMKHWLSTDIVTLKFISLGYSCWTDFWRVSKNCGSAISVRSYPSLEMDQ